MQASAPLLPRECASSPSPTKTAIFKHWSAISGHAEGIAAERPALDQADVVAAERALAVAADQAINPKRSLCGLDGGGNTSALLWSMFEFLGEAGGDLR